MFYIYINMYLSKSYIYIFNITVINHQIQYYQMDLIIYHHQNNSNNNRAQQLTNIHKSNHHSFQYQINNNININMNHTDPVLNLSSNSESKIPRSEIQIINSASIPLQKRKFKLIYQIQIIDTTSNSEDQLRPSEDALSIKKNSIVVVWPPRYKFGLGAYIYIYIYIWPLFVG